MTTHLAVHTPMPLMPLTQMVVGMARIVVEVDGLGNQCCFYGWAEAMDSPSCKPHHVVSGADPTDNVTLLWLAWTLTTLGYEAVVTEGETHDGDHTVLDSAPMLYEDDHNH